MIAMGAMRAGGISDYILEKMQETGIKCLWGTVNMFGTPRFMNGAGSGNSADERGNGMTEAMPFLQKYDITFLRPPTIRSRVFLCLTVSRS